MKDEAFVVETTTTVTKRVRVWAQTYDAAALLAVRGYGSELAYTETEPIVESVRKESGCGAHS